MRATYNHYQLALTTALSNADVISVLDRREGDDFLDLGNVQAKVISPLNSDHVQVEIIFNYRDIDGQNRELEDVLVEVVLGPLENRVIHVRGI